MPLRGVRCTQTRQGRRHGAREALKVCIAGKGGAGKTTVTALLARELAGRGRRVLAVDCDPNPNLAESFGEDSASLLRFSFDDLRPAPGTLELEREPELVECEEGLWLLGGPPSANALNDAVARGIAGVLIADRFDDVITDLGAGPEFTRTAVGGALNPAEVCVILSDGTRASDMAAERIAEACRDREVPWMQRPIEVDRPLHCVPALANDLLER